MTYTEASCIWVLRLGEPDAPLWYGFANRYTVNPRQAFSFDSHGAAERFAAQHCHVPHTAETLVDALTIAAQVN